MALDKKMDILMSKSLPRPVEVRPVPKPSVNQPVHAHDPIPGSGRSHDQHKGRQMHQATCADCKKECEIPFKPSGERPVYCKECFSRRRSGNAPKVVVENNLKEVAVIPAAIPVVMNIPEPLVKEKKKPVAAKKPVVKKKPVPAKKKK
ncbi:MAG: hypothetical protein HQL21_02340 [Candidatus Omnitrophica bacterium]|nr:hypothetical protein [Candidatus Omnitrophota bacterium]